MCMPTGQKTSVPANSTERWTPGAPSTSTNQPSFHSQRFLLVMEKYALVDHVTTCDSLAYLLAPNLSR